MTFFMSEAERLANESVGDSQAFMLIHSGRSIRKRSNWHLHVFVVQRRWEKAWVYLILGVKNTALALYSIVCKALGLASQAPNQSFKRTPDGGGYRRR